ncbi:hypothetical protein HMPREF0083_04118 [Aneurinibacillus aneurinilyticus ATCC 12856]|uniref:Uncharacterized protein n=1 Tax=Aneurinibacillus aneurinilyticus ATCC 12856 TaxID=649747 RepID=U1WYP8_ANEAE|nr:hypothetical protein HMPREF0083_04118 [Aneurinibacillus aneurinilyticus ATCC 12856]
MIIHKGEERRCTRRRVPSSFSRGRDTAALWRQGRTGKTSGPLGVGDEPTHVWARCGDDSLWIILDSQQVLYIIA